MIRVHRNLRYVPYTHTCLRSALCSLQILSSSLFLYAHSNIYIYCPEVIMSFVALPRLIHLWRCLKAYLIYTQKYLLLPVELGCTTCLSTSTSVERSKISSYRSSKGNVFSYSKLSEEPSEVDLSIQIAMNPHPELYLEFLAENEALVGCAIEALALRICQAVVHIIYLLKFSALICHIVIGEVINCR